MRAIRLAASVTILVAALALALTAWAADNNVGTWKLNVAKSKYSPGPPPKSGTLKIQAHGDGVMVVSEGVDADGKPTKLEYTAHYDGKDNPLKGSPTADTIALKRVDEQTVEGVAKKGGKITGTTRAVVSKDGKTRTLTLKGKNAQGQDVHNVVVYERVK